MRVNPISVNYQSVKTRVRKNNCPQEPVNVSFQGKHDCAKLFGTAMGGLGTLGALGGLAIMTGGLSILPSLAYGAICGGAGAYVGHQLDKEPDPDDKDGK